VFFEGGDTGISLSVNIVSVNVPAYWKSYLPVTKKKYCTAASALKVIEEPEIDTAEPVKSSTQLGVGSHDSPAKTTIWWKKSPALVCNVMFIFVGGVYLYQTPRVFGLYLQGP
jgi:hypothetical protein